MSERIEFFEVVWVHDDNSASLNWLNQHYFESMKNAVHSFLIKTGQTRTVEIEVENE
jgi:hypothetical protein